MNGRITLAAWVEFDPQETCEALDCCCAPFEGIELAQISQEVTERFYNLLATRWARLASLNTVPRCRHIITISIADDTAACMKAGRVRRTKNGSSPTMSTSTVADEVSHSPPSNGHHPPRQSLRDCRQLTRFGARLWCNSRTVLS